MDGFQPELGQMAFGQPWQQHDVPEIMEESVFGSSFPDLWDFHQEMDGSITVYRKVEKPLARPKRVASPPSPTTAQDTIG